MQPTRKAEQITYTRLNENKGRPRLWIEGVKLAAAGFNRNDRYDIIRYKDGLGFKLTPNGKYKVSGRVRNGRDIAIIDCNNPLLTEQFEMASRVRVAFTDQLILVKAHHEDCAKSQREKQFKQHMAKGYLNKASLFTGGGISTTAIHDALTDCGLSSQLCWVADAELKYLQSAEKNSWAVNDETAFIVGEVEEVEPVLFKNVDLLSFSMPCAGFSRAGRSKHKQSSEEHSSGTSLFGVINAISHSNPSIIVSENVKEAMGSPIYTLLIAELKRRKYHVMEQVLSNEHTGSFENRQRYWFVAVSEGLSENLSLNLDRKKPHDMKLSDFLEQDIPESMWADNDYLKAKQLRDLKAKKGFACRQLLNGTENSIACIGRFYAKKRSTDPFIVREDGKERLLTPVEHAKVKAVPPALIAGIASSRAHEILGQGIDYLQGYLPVKHVIKQLQQLYCNHWCVE